MILDTLSPVEDDEFETIAAARTVEETEAVLLPS